MTPKGRGRCEGDVAGFALMSQSRLSYVLVGRHDSMLYCSDTGDGVNQASQVQTLNV